MQKKGIIISWIALAISLITLGVVFWRVSPNSVIDLGTFIGVVAAFIGISVTLLIGYQIYNSIEIKEKIDKISNLEIELQQRKVELESLRSEVYEEIYQTQARLYNGTPRGELDGYIMFHHVIKYALSNKHEEGYDWMLEELKQYMVRINGMHLLHGPEKGQRKENLIRFKKEVESIDQEIRNHRNYYYIRGRYEKYMGNFYKQLDLISDPQNLDKILTEINKLWYSE